MLWVDAALTRARVQVVGQRLGNSGQIQKVKGLALKATLALSPQRPGAPGLCGQIPEQLQVLDVPKGVLGAFTPDPIPFLALQVNTLGDCQGAPACGHAGGPAPPAAECCSTWQGHATALM